MPNLQFEYLFHVAHKEQIYIDFDSAGNIVSAIIRSRELGDVPCLEQVLKSEHIKKQAYDHFYETTRELKYKEAFGD